MMPTNCCEQCGKNFHAEYGREAYCGTACRARAKVRLLSAPPPTAREKAREKALAETRRLQRLHPGVALVQADRAARGNRPLPAREVSVTRGFERLGELVGRDPIEVRQAAVERWFRRQK
jgi:hypothetical protein